MLHIYEKYETIKQREVKYEAYRCEDAEIIIAAYGTMARVVKNVIGRAASEGLKVGLIRPITLWPFPYDVFSQWADKPQVKAFLSVEMSMGQMVEDVRLGVNGKKPAHFYGRTGGMVPDPGALLAEIKKIAGGE